MLTKKGIATKRKKIKVKYSINVIPKQLLIRSKHYNLCIL